MANNQPLQWQTPIVDPETGRPNKEFMRWAQQRLEDIDGALTPDQLEAILETIAIAAGNGLSGGGNLSAGTITINVNVGTGITIDADAVTLADTAVTPGTYGDATHVPQFDVDQQGRLLFAQNVPISGGGGGATSLVGRFVAAGGETTASIAIPAGLKKIEIEWLARVNGGTNANLFMRLNNDATTNAYEWQRVTGLGSSAGALRQTGTAFGWDLTGNVITGRADSGKYTIVNPDDTSFHTVVIGQHSLCFASGGTGTFILANIGYWNNTAAIASVDFSLTGGFNFVAGTVIEVWGYS